MMKLMLLIALAVCAALAVPAARAATCTAPASGSSVQVPGRPFGMAISSDGCWIFVALADTHKRGGIAVLHDNHGTYAVARVVALHHPGMGDALTHDGKLLIAAAWSDVAVFDVAKLEQATAVARIGTLNDGYRPGQVYVAASRDGKLLFVSEEREHRLAVYNLEQWQARSFKGNPLVGHIPTGPAPVGLAVSSDGQWLYSTSEATPRRAGYDDDCKPEVRSGRWHAQGLLLRISVAKAATQPRESVAGVLQAGCNPVRVAISPNDTWLWVTARGSNAVLRIPVSAFDSHTTKLHIGGFDVGGEPVGVAVRPDGTQVWVAQSDRFPKKGGHQHGGQQLVGLLGAGNAAATSVKMVHQPASGFPRELDFLPNGRTLAIGLYRARRIEFITTLP